LYLPRNAVIASSCKSAAATKGKIKMQNLFACMAATTLLITAPVFAQDGTDSELRCGTNLVQPGTPKVKVITWCGEPTDREGAQWIYQQGTTQPAVTVHFEDDDTVNRITGMDLD
jgi:hypothetical protein